MHGAKARESIVEDGGNLANKKLGLIEGERVVDCVNGIWERALDPETQRIYEYNATTNESRWVDNEEEEPRDDGASDWVATLDEVTGLMYEYNSKTNETRWIQDQANFP